MLRIESGPFKAKAHRIVGPPCCPRGAKVRVGGNHRAGGDKASDLSGRDQGGRGRDAE